MPPLACLPNDPEAQLQASTMSRLVARTSSLQKPELELSEREQIILRAIIQTYVLRAAPIGSHTLARMLARTLRLSPATIRNVMAELEDRGYLTHPHTSAGRIPTDKGYRFYVDYLMHQGRLSQREEQTLRENLSAVSGELALRTASRILGELSHLLGVAQLPSLRDLVIRRVELVSLSSQRFAVVVDLDSAVVRTLTLETDVELNPGELSQLAQLLNERLSGRTLDFIRQHFSMLLQERLSHPVLRLFADSIEVLFAQHESHRVYVAGAQQLVQLPEFSSPDRFRAVIELLENEEMIIHLLESSSDAPLYGVQVKIGHELGDRQLTDYALISTRYRIGSATYAIGVVGPKRMNYAKMMALVGEVAGLLARQQEHSPSVA
ncbi:MAG: heat-inducible transcription repressor HrcA [Candidatus Kapaibacterium sp.]|nr:MAG: heat-inducible transcription repressor HrcA [Candidatus Kapabacteria bacterium]